MSIDAERCGLRAAVRTSDGWSLGHAIVTITNMAGEQVALASADGDGAVRTEPLPQGVHTVIVTAPGYQPSAASIIVPLSGRVEMGPVVLTRQSGAELPPPGYWTVDPVHSAVTAVARHIGISSIRGRFTEFRAQILVADTVENSAVTASIAAASIDTGDPTRDEHLRSRDFLGAAEHPEIIYQSAGALTPAGPDRWIVHGELNMNGRARPVDLDLTYLGTGPDAWGGTRAAFRATAELRREDFAMTYNQIVRAGIAMVGTTLRVELDIQAQLDARPAGAAS